MGLSRVPAVWWTVALAPRERWLRATDRSSRHSWTGERHTRWIVWVPYPWTRPVALMLRVSSDEAVGGWGGFGVRCVEETLARYVAASF